MKIQTYKDENYELHIFLLSYIFPFKRNEIIAAFSCVTVRNGYVCMNICIPFFTPQPRISGSIHECPSFHKYSNNGASVVEDRDVEEIGK